MMGYSPLMFYFSQLFPELKLGAIESSGQMKVWGE